MQFSELKGLTLTNIEGGLGSETMTFTEKSGREFKMFHYQSCCESVDIEDISGDLSDLLDSPILLAEETSSDKNPEGMEIPEYQDSFTWTFYKLATINGSVTIRWYGSSNGYYGESVDFEETTSERSS